MISIYMTKAGNLQLTHTEYGIDVRPICHNPPTLQNSMRFVETFTCNSNNLLNMNSGQNSMENKGTTKSYDFPSIEFIYAVSIPNGSYK